MHVQVILHHFGLREGSGGKGEFRGGEGVLREIEFRRAVTVRKEGMQCMLPKWSD